ncbi:MAG: PLDc N-terminal domain-containing protein [Chryseotalea sp. WA131a]|nr:MAG: PLDc N-terminal domain-containing protein [Chryseotalea sp. WA131a]
MQLINSPSSLVLWQVMVIANVSLLVFVFFTVLKRQITSFEKVAWLLISAFVPFIGSLAYIITFFLKKKITQ